MGLIKVESQKNGTHLSINLGRSRRTLERMRVEGAGPRYLKVGPGKRSRVLYRHQDAEDRLARSHFVPKSENLLTSSY